MISFKLAPQTHAKVSRASAVFFKLLFVAAVLFLGYKAIGGYLRASSILADHSVVSVPVQLVEVTEERGRKGRRRNMYHFGYSFEAGGERHEGRFTTSESNADPYLGEDVTIEVAYANAEPARFDRLERLQSQSGLGSLVVRLLVAVAGAALIMFLMHLLLTAKLFVPRVPEQAPEAAG